MTKCLSLRSIYNLLSFEPIKKENKELHMKDETGLITQINIEYPKTDQKANAQQQTQQSVGK